MGLWGYIISHTSQSPVRLIAFGTFCIGATWLIGSVFSSLTTGSLDVKQRRMAADEMSVENKRLATAQQQRLSAMLKDVSEGRGDDHWNAVMRGTLVPHPMAESKTEGVDRERIAKALSSAKQ
ncbi:hypothetical protein Vretimale_15616 [Volvox reticuliferus]|uniref:Uncharacterized protein n=1 Tax=Volvox reticuliferus TaxID=1737510 RepID=A0A8J4GR61_9CHLO|nr:hypothetical protein Vretifemale_15020 [Volvox reticuliferus]GIM12223.1 hypothetical protein Vretimale_15616 [Volvox reticuliferus]